MKTRLVLCVLSMLLFAMVPSLLAQVGTEGEILGVVKDSSGAVVAGVEVTVVNLDTGLKKTAVTDSAGAFEIQALARGPYSVTASFTGFKTWSVERTDLSVGELKRLSPVLEVGEVSEKVTVEATAELVQTEKGSVESVVTQKQILELPLSGRNPVELVRLVPGMRYGGQDGAQGERAFRVQGLGARDDMNEFQVDGLNSNAAMDEGGIAIPNVDTIAEFNIETSNFSAEHGRNPIQILSVTKSGTNAFHGSAWEFLRNDALDARNTFANSKPKLRRNQFGASGGGPIIKNKTFFFASYEGTRVRQDSIYNSYTIDPNFLQGDFSSLGKPINDPETGNPFPGNQIPADRISDASKAFFPYILLPNSSGSLFKANASRPSQVDEFTVRVDHQLTDKQRIYGRYYINKYKLTEPGYRPDVPEDFDTKQQSMVLNYTYAATPTTLFTVGANYLRSLNLLSSPVVGTTNLTEEAGIHGFPTAGRDAFVGLPSVWFSGYTGFAPPWGVNGRLWFESHGGKASANLIRGAHSLNIGYEYNNRSTYGRHGSCCSRGNFGFNGQQTGDGFADYLLGLPSEGGRNYPLQTFGMHSSPYSALYVQDFWKVHPNVTLNLGLRYDYWHDKAAVRGNVATFDTTLGKVVAGEVNGQIDLTSQPVAPYLAEDTKDMWVSASEAGLPGGLFVGNGYLSPRVGIAWRPFGNNSTVVRGGYGIFTSSFRGNMTASAIVGPPYWTYEYAYWSAAEKKRWETIWPDDPTAFVSPGVQAADPRVKSMKTHQWNLSVQRELPGDSALTVSYVGNRGRDLITQSDEDAVPPGVYDNLQAAKPYPELGSVLIYRNIGKSWYNAMMLKWEKRFAKGFSYMASYSFSKNIGESSNDVWNQPTPFSPAGYERGRSSLDRTHILGINGIYELPFGKGKTHLSDIHPVGNAILGGWQLSGIYNFTSGQPLTFGTPGGTLGNGYGTRANIVGTLDVANPSANQWFNPAALAPAPALAYGSSGIGIFDGPGSHVLDTSLSKKFLITESKYVQFRWEMFNMPNHVNLNNPNTTQGQGSTGKIFSAGGARSMQFGLKLVF
jgi:outer membrane receptor protein involved in Fe transport